MIEDVYTRIWQLSPRVGDKTVYDELTDLTRELIGLYDQQGRLSDDPFNPTRSRSLSLPFEQVNNLLKGATCIVTGGLGCVGTALIRELLQFELGSIIILDKKSSKESDLPPRVKHYTCDVRDLKLVKKIFDKVKPQFVFHAAAQRDPGYAEKNVYETISTNVTGTLNMVRVSEECGTVKQFVFSSTGKASRYFTEEVYAGTKKMCEYILDTFSKIGRVKYSMVRFTHILDNSLMNQALMNEAEKKDFIAVHCPGKFVTAQNVKEAAYLMINALIYAEEKHSNFLLVRNLEWPVESLEMALYYIKRSGRSMPVIFMGNPIGYTEKFFRGQMDWSNPQELNLLINVYEQRYRRYNQESDIIISHISPVSGSLVLKALERIELAEHETDCRDILIAGLREIVRDSLSLVNKEDTVNILNWGLQRKFLEIEKAKMDDYGPIIPMMFESLAHSGNYAQVESLLYQNV